MKLLIFILMTSPLSAVAMPRNSDIVVREFNATIPRIAKKLGEQVYADSIQCKYTTICSVPTASGLNCEVAYDDESFVIERYLNVFCYTESGPGYRDKTFKLRRSPEFIAESAREAEVSVNAKVHRAPVTPYHGGCSPLDLVYGKCYPR